MRTILYTTLALFLFFSCRKEIKSKPQKEAIKKVVPWKKASIDKDEKNGGLLIPEYFTAVTVVDSIGPSRHLAVNDNGDIYVKLREKGDGHGSIALRDTTGDGRANIIKKFGGYPNDGEFATEMRIHNGYLYFSSEQVIYRQKLTPGKLLPENNPEVILTDRFPLRWHNAKSLTFDNEGYMYVTFSAPTNTCEDANSQGKIKGLMPCPMLEYLGSIWRFDKNKVNQIQTDGELFATGIRSIVGISWNNQDDALYAVQHGRDYLHNHAPEDYTEWDQAVLPAEEFMKIEKDDNFGWPYSYYDHFKGKKLLAPEYGGNGKIEAKEYKKPLMGLPAHWAPNDLLFYTGNQFPDRYKKGAFIAFHGSTNRTPYPQAGYVVAFVPFENGKPKGTWEVFADGFARTDTIASMPDAKYRPMGLAQDKEGALYISESKEGRIWKIEFKGDKGSFGHEKLKKMELLKSKTYIKTPDKVKDRLKS